MTNETEIDVTNPDRKPWAEYTNAEKAAHFTALDAGGRHEFRTTRGWVETDLQSINRLSAYRAYRVIPAPVKTSRTYEMQPTDWDRADGFPIMSSCQTGRNWQQGTTTVYFEDGKPVRAVWEATS